MPPTLRQLAGDLIQAQETARVALARNLHDDICQELVAIAMSITNLTRSLDRVQDEQNRLTLAMLHRAVLEIADRIRLISHDLHPATLQLLGLAAAVRTHCLEVERRFDLSVTMHTEGELKHIDADTALCLFRITQEALQNAAVHSMAHVLHVSLVRYANEIELMVHDDGCGFDVDAVRSECRGLGLLSVEERAHALGGSVLIVSVPSDGTTILARVPARAGRPARSGTEIERSVAGV